LLELGWYLAAVVAAALLARRMVPARGSWKLGALMAGSFVVAIPWVMQLRGDFPGIACSLLALYFLMSSKPSDVWWAGLLAGLAPQFKITFVAAGAAGGLYLLVFRRWDQLWRFAVAAGLSSVGVYAVLAWREPGMLSNILMLRKMIQHPPGVVGFVREVLREPVFLLALATGGALVVPMLRQRRPRWFLLGSYLGLGFVVAVCTSLQAGANINYFYELLLGSTPLVVLGMLHLRAERWSTAAVLAGLLMIVALGLPGHIRDDVWEALHVRGQIAQRNHDYEAWGTIVDGTKLLSTIPDVTVLRSERVMTDSLLLNYLQITAGVDLSSLERRIHESEFDIVVTQPKDNSWRGVYVLPRGVKQALLDSYLPYCLLEEHLALLPSQPKDDRAIDDLRERLRKAGCNVQAVKDCLKDGKCGLQVAEDLFRPTF
jgi:hypothetical protein